MTRIGSLFSGIGGLELGVQAALGGEVVWQSEIEPAACRVLEHRFPGVPNLGDITTVDWAAVPPIDLICGGYPCQPFSTAGNRKGTDDDRHLWPFVRDALRVLRPRYALLENVRGHLTLGFDRVLADLAEIGFDAEWGVFRSSDVGAPHRRERLFVLAHNTDRLVGSTPVAFGDRSEQYGRVGAGTDSGHRSVTADTNSEPAWRDPGTAFGAEASRQDEPCESDSDRPELRCATAADSDCADGFPINDNGRPGSGELHARGFIDGRCPDHHRAGDRERTNWGRYAAAIERWERLTGVGSPDPVDGRGRLNPMLPEWMMGFPTGWVTGVDGVSRAQALKCVGNAVQPQVAAVAVSELVSR